MTGAIKEKGRRYKKLADRKQTRRWSREQAGRRKKVKTEHLNWERKVVPVFRACLDCLPW